MKRKGFSIYIATALVVITAALFCFAACDGGGKSAVIIIPDAFASAMRDTVQNKDVWDPVEKDVDILSVARGDISVKDVVDGLGEDKDSVLQQFWEALAYTPDSLTYRLSVGDDGALIDDKIAPAPPSAAKYGAFDMYGDLVRGVKAEVGADRDVFVFNWDWRIDPSVEAKRLREYLEKEGYTRNIFISHGQGSAVINLYLALDKTCRRNTVCNIELAPTALGSFDALALLVCPEKYFERALEGFDASQFGVPLIADNATLIRILTNFCTNRQGCFLNNNIALISMLPSAQLLLSGQYDGLQGGGIVRNGETLSTAEEIYAFYATRAFAYRLEQNEDGAYVRAESDGGYVVKDAVAQLADYFNGMFVNGRIASESVRSYYIVSSGLPTVTRLACDSALENGVTKTDSYGDTIYEYRLVSLSHGDGNAPLYSFLGGSKAQMNAVMADGRVIDLQNVSHLLLGIDWDAISPHVAPLLR